MIVLPQNSLHYHLTKLNQPRYQSNKLLQKKLRRKMILKNKAILYSILKIYNYITFFYKLTLSEFIFYFEISRNLSLVYKAYAYM